MYVEILRQGLILEPPPEHLFKALPEELFELPKDLGEFEDKTVSVGIGKFGPYIRHDNKYISIPKDINPHEISLEEAIQLIDEKREEDRRRILRTFTEDPELQMLNGRFGPYLSKGGKNYKLPRSKNLEELSYEECVEIMNAADASTDDSEKKPRRGRYSKKG